MKVSTDTVLLREGVSADLIKECSTYSRILHSDNLAKGLFSRLNKAKQVMILEHYSINIEDLFKDMALPWDVRAKLIRAVFYQIVHGLNELHALGFIHKDLKAPNILVAYDGRVLVADFGLTTYLVRGADTPQIFYMKETSAPIEPPEGNNADPKSLIGKSYDIWSLGCVLSYMIRREDIFDMWRMADEDEDWRQEDSDKLMEGYTLRRTVILDYFNENLKHRPAPPSPEFLEHGKKLMEKMLSFKPEGRPTAKEILENKWFEGMTIGSAMEEVRAIMSTTDKKNTFGNVGRSKIIGATRKITNANANTHRNNVLSLSGYFRIIPQKTLDTFLTPDMHTLLLDEIKELFIGSVKHADGFVIYTYLHALELFSRLNDVVFSKMPRKLGKKVILPYLYICFNIALKITPVRYVYQINIPAMVKIIGTPIESLSVLNMEIDVIKKLNGDMYPQVDGLVDKVIGKILSNKLRSFRKITTLKIFNKIFKSSETIDSYIDLQVGDEEYSVPEGVNFMKVIGELPIA
jgi:hypothetical protein